MIERKRLLALAFYNKEHFSGSDSERNLRYRIEKVVPKLPEDAPEDAEPEEPYFQATIWPEPYSFEKTDDEKKITHREDFSEEGLCAIVDWMNEHSFEKEDWKR